MRRVLSVCLDAFVQNFGLVVEAVCLALLAALGAWLCCRGLDHAYRCLKAQLGGVDNLTRAVLLALCVSLAPVAASKFFNGTWRMGVPSSSSTHVGASSSIPQPRSSALAISDFALTLSSAVFEVNWPFGARAADSLVWIQARTNLVAGAWEPVWCKVPGDVPSRRLDVEVPFAALPSSRDGMPPRSAFFAAEAQILADFDRDGVPDREEAGWTEFGAELPVFDFADAVESVTLFDSAEDGWWDDRPLVPLPFTVWCGGVPSTNAVALANGVVGFLSTGREERDLYDSTWNEDFSDECFVYSDDHAAVAACWTNLDVPRDPDASIRCGTFGAAPGRWFVVEYEGVTLSERAWDDDPPRATFQIAVSEAAPATVHVRYLALSNGFDFASATLGSQGPGGGPTLPVAYNVATAATNGTVISYHFGHGSDPQLRDTDGDGLDDGWEVDHGLSPRLADTDGDGLPDKWELDHGFDPLSVIGDDGRDGDPDLDGLPNISEYAHGTDPCERDIDRDGLLDGEEVGGITATNALPWLAFDAGTAVDLTLAFSDSSWALANWGLPVPLVVQGMSVTNAVLDVNGTVYFVRAGGEGPEWSQGLYDLSGDYVVQPDALLVAPYWGNLSLEPELPTRIRAGTATHEGVGYLLIEYEGACQDLWWDETNAVSFQVALPTNGADRAYVRYLDVTGSETDGRYAAVGFQTFGGRTRASYCFRETGRVCGGLALQFLFGTGSDPFADDTDNDGLDDAVEARQGTDPARVDTDSDGIPDKWELDHGLAPRNPNDAALDPDGDGLSNLEEYLNQTDPGVLSGPAAGRDSDGDGVDDGTEVGQGSDPNDSSDRGTAPPEDEIRELAFNIDGDYAAWEMTIEGLGPVDRRTQKITMGAPNAPQDVPKKLRRGNSYHLSMRWLNSDGHTDPYRWYCWQAKIDGIPSSRSYVGYSNERRPGNEVLAGNGWVAENAGGLLTAHVHMHDPDADGYGGGNVAGHLVATLHVLGDPRLTPDYDRDGKIDVIDEKSAAQGRVFRFWTNDDGDRSSADGDMARAVADEFPFGGLDWDSGQVNGRRDLVDYAPVRLDLQPVTGNLPQTVRISLTYRLRQADGALNVVWSRMSVEGLSAFFRNDLSGFGPLLNQDSRSAEKERVGSEGLNVPDGFVALATNGRGQGVFWVDGRHQSTAPLWIEVLYGSRVVCSSKLEIGISNVEDMYRWLSQRGVCGASVERASSLGEPTNFPDRESDGGQFVFVHGYNVDERSARAWSAEMFKRLWQSGSRKMFTAATWYGNDSQSTLYLGNTPDYYSNVDHALSTAETFSRSIAALPGTAKYVAAHSLGNMLVSSAISEHGLSVTRYFMLNAAVPIEAYAPSAVTEATRANMTPADWRPYALGLRANHWYELFDTCDARRDLTWKGRFAAINNAVNYYSEGEDVLNNADGQEHQLLSADYAWANQETRKGVWPLLLPGNNEAGWSFNSAHDVVNTNYLNGGGPLMLRLTPEQAGQLTDNVLKQCPFFGAFDDMSICTTNRIVNLPQKNQLLADAIPAESYAAGRNLVSVLANVEMQGLKTGGGDWTHSFLIEAPYAWTYKVFDDIRERTNQ